MSAPQPDQPKDKTVPPPPEPEFFDEVKEKQPPKKDVLGILQKNWWIVVCAGFVLLVLCWNFFAPKPARKSTALESSRDEKRELVTTAAMEHAINRSSKAISPAAGAREDIYRVKKETRKLGSNIAVFVEAPKPEKGFSAGNSGDHSQKKKTALGLSSGTRVPALLSSRVFSFNIEAPVTAVAAKDFVYKEKVVIPKDSQFLGEADVVKSADRINVRFNLLILPDGTEIRIRALALSEDGSAGLKGKVDKYTDRRVLKAIGETLVVGASLFTGGSQSDPFSLEDQMRMNLAQNLTGEATRDLRSSKIEKSVTVEALTPVQVIFLEAV